MTHALGRASGKVILAGEHAVVYGVPALAVGIDRGARARAERGSPGQPSRLTVRIEGSAPVSATTTEDDPLARAFRDLLSSISRSRGSEVLAVVDVGTDLPAGAGLGCSAALGIAVARAVCDLERGASDDEVREHAMAWERVFHGTPSGIDAAVAALGGTLLYTRGDDGQATVEPVPAKTPLVLAVGHSGQASSTKTMVDSVARLRQRQPAMTGKTFDAIASVVRNARLAIEAGDLVALGKLLDMNQMLLAGLLLSTQEIEDMCQAARSQGALGAKLTGAGGGGCVVALTDTRARAERVIAAWALGGKTGFVTEVTANPRARVSLGSPEVQP